MTDTRPKPVRLWTNICSTERQPMSDLAFAWASMSQFVLKEQVDAYFELSDPTWWELRLAVFVAVWELVEDTIIIGETEFPIYVADQTWMGQLYAALLSGDVSLEDDYGLLLNGFAPPFPLEP